MNGNRTHRLLCAALVASICLLGTARVLADAYGASWGYVEANVELTGPNDKLLWNTDPEDWLLHAEGDVYHMHPPLSHDYGADSELWDPVGDGVVNLGSVLTGDLAEVKGVEARVASTGGPYVDINVPQDVYSYAHDVPNSFSDAAALGQHDNLFWIEFNGPDDPPPLTTVSFSLTGSWNLIGDSDPDDYWWADWYTYFEVYYFDEFDQLVIMDFRDEYHFLEGPGFDSDSGLVDLQFELELEYGQSYALRFWQDAESHAEAVPEPATLGLLLIGYTFVLRRSRARGRRWIRPAGA